MRPINNKKKTNKNKIYSTVQYAYGKVPLNQRDKLYFSR